MARLDGKLDASAVKVREFAVMDRPRIIEMIKALTAFELGFERDRIVDHSSSAEHLRQLEDEIATCGGALLVAEAGGERPQLCGFIATMIRTDSPFLEQHLQRFLYIADIFIEDGFRNRGVGHMMLRRAERFAHDQGIQRVAVGALTSNTAARETYARWGFRPYAVEYTKDIGPKLSDDEVQT